MLLYYYNWHFILPCERNASCVSRHNSSFYILMGLQHFKNLPLFLMTMTEAFLNVIKMHSFGARTESPYAYEEKTEKLS